MNQTSQPHHNQLQSQSIYTFSAKEKDDETGYSYFGARYYDSELSVWLSVDALTGKFPNISGYAYCSNNPVMLVDPNGKENVPALLWAGKNMLNKAAGVNDISCGSWYNYCKDENGKNIGYTRLTKEVPSYASCYEACWHSYLNSTPEINRYLQTGFTDKNNSFKGRNIGKQWFIEGKNAGTNKDGLSRSFETNIMKGEIGDIVFMEGHACLLAQLPEVVSENYEGIIDNYIALTVYSATSYGFKEQVIKFRQDGSNKTNGWTGFEGYGQIHRGDNILVERVEPIQIKQIPLNNNK